MSLKLKVNAMRGRLGMTRANYYKARCVRQVRETDDDRAVQPRLGGRKLHCILGGKLVESGIRLGRDRFFDVLRRRKLLPGPLPEDNELRHNLPVARNLVKDMELTGPNQGPAADITYIRTDGGFDYLALIHDKWSRKITGWLVCRRHFGDGDGARGAAYGAGRTEERGASGSSQRPGLSVLFA